MTFKEQIAKIKDNWLLILLFVIVVGFLAFGNNMGSVGYGIAGYAQDAMYEMAPAMAKSSYSARGYYPSPSPYYEQDFAPEVEERKITKSSSLSTEVGRGTFFENEARLKNIITTSDAYLLNEDVNKYETGRKQYFYGTYSIKVETGKYDAVIAQLKEIGKVQSFNQDADDITGTYTNIQVELDAEKARLARYQKLYDEATSVQEKLDLSDRMFNQERTIKYYEDRLANMDSRVSYSSISFTLTEKRSEYVDVVWVKFGQLIARLVSSINSLLTLVFVVLPYALAAGIIYGIVKAVKARKQKRK